MLSGAGAAGCGDALLPSDYAGPPVAEVSGVISAGTPTEKVAQFPELSLEWLSVLDAPKDRSSTSDLAGQSLRFARSNRLDNDWDIGLLRPSDSAKLSFGQVKFSVGKLVYFDDRARDGRIDWRCAGTGCDLVKAISSEYVVYLEATPVCRTRPGQAARPELTPGFHYFRVERGLPLELRSDESMTFAISDRAPFASDPSTELRNFVGALFRLWSIDALTGC